MGRGNRGASVFKTDADRGLFLETLAEAVERTGWVVHAWVLMKTHSSGFHTTATAANLHGPGLSKDYAQPCGSSGWTKKISKR